MYLSVKFKNCVYYEYVFIYIPNKLAYFVMRMCVPRLQHFFKCGPAYKKFAIPAINYRLKYTIGIHAFYVFVRIYTYLNLHARNYELKCMLKIYQKYKCADAVYF